MGFKEWLGFSPKGAGAPDVRDDVRTSLSTFLFGVASSGERVDERTSMQLSTVYACVRLLAESVAQLPLHLYRADGPAGQQKADGHPLYRILYREPNRR